MTNWPLQSDTAAMHATFGNPDANNDGAPDPAWAAQHLTTIVPPYAMEFAGRPVTRMTCNKAIAAPLLAALQGVKALYGMQAAIEARGLHHFGGVYNFRPKRLGRGSLSLHAYAAAIDLDPGHNLQGKAGGAMPAEVVAVFKANGAIWGGDWSPRYRDPMHFQWARV
jgi:hypothetical protein